LHSFTAPTDQNANGRAINSDGALPVGGLASLGDTIYGTTSSGGDSGNGTVFAIGTDGTGFSTLYIFSAISPCCPSINADGAYPAAGLVISGNTLYGTASYGGDSGAGTVFAVNTDGTDFTTLHSFAAQDGNNAFGYPLNSDGIKPTATLVLSGNILLGTASYGGRSGNGTLFALNTDGTGFTNLHTFTALNNGANFDGAYPAGGLVLSGNTLYGAAVSGGTSGGGTVFAINMDGTSFRTVHSFDGGSGGGSPSAGLTFSNETLYGTTLSGGSLGNGTVFKVQTDGSGFHILHNFADSVTDGYSPDGGVIL
jgi:uncharacterized repeat protein (TIGR03803 family)